MNGKKGSDNTAKAAALPPVSADAPAQPGTVGGDVLIAYGLDGRLRGFQGDDELWGGEGFDRLKGDQGADLFVFKSQAGAFNAASQQVDRIRDFTTSDRDQIALDRTSFGLTSKRGTGFSNLSEFAIAENTDDAAVSNARIVFVQKASQLVFKSNGPGAGFGASGGSYAELPGIAQLANQDFLII